jgi:hypothetical protein
MDIEQALLDPASAYRAPAEVLDDRDLSREEKIKVLRRWEYDARELEVAEEENMGGGPPDLLDEVLTALRQLDAQTDMEHRPPTKQGGA